MCFEYKNHQTVLDTNTLGLEFDTPVIKIASAAVY